ncbi:cytochrome P450 [Mycobacterium nebraskense]|uniref:cytochrome P450 n=1 Tax=Mycobacterium nebraskense TaxID=244292 RepID=UPI0012E1EEF8|nr:cytochrome P450 [Mycobacterium nebraskense]
MGSRRTVSALMIGLADCPAFPAEAWELLTIDRGEAWRLVREAGPVLRGPPVASYGDAADFSVYLTRRAEALATLHNPDFGDAEAFHPTLRIRRGLELLFTPRDSRKFAESCRSEARALIARPFRDGIRDIAIPLIHKVFSCLCGVTPDDVRDTDHPDTATMLLAMIRRRKHAPGNDFLSRLVHLDELTAQWIAYTTWINIVNIAGQFAYCIRDLASNPELGATLHDQPELIRVFVEENLRLDNVAPTAIRKTVRDTVIGGVDVPAGLLVHSCLVAVNRDGSDSMSSEEYVLTAGAHRHWGFGGGSHRCPASHLARETLRVLVEEWVTQVERAELPPDYVPRVWLPRVQGQSAWWLRELPLIDVRRLAG